MRYVRCLVKLDMTDTIHLKIKICVNLFHQCHLCAIKHNAKLSFMKLPSKYIALVVVLSLAAIFAYQAYWLVNLYRTWSATSTKPCA